MDERESKTLNPLTFLQAFIVQSIRVAEMSGAEGDSPDHIATVGLATSSCLEEVARRHLDVTGPLDHDTYGALITDIKNRIGGRFERAPGEAGSVRVINHRCPFGDLVKEAPELCRMTSSVFGAIAARNFGYAKVELRKRIATGDGLCDVRIHLDPARVAAAKGDEYRWEGGTVTALSGATAVTERVEEFFCKTWAGPSGNFLKEPLRRRIVAESQAMQAALQAVEVVAPTPASVLVTGETGVGKEVIARAVHAISRRADRVFLAVNCGAIPENLVDSTLFGHEKGAFTDAHQASAGLFERADGGTLFLDEVDCLTPSAQSRLLRVLQEGEYERVGGHSPRHTDVRIVAASNRRIDGLVADGSFRRDLYYRLNVVPIHIPPLRQRPDDINALVVHFMKRLEARYGGPPKVLGERAWAVALGYDWPGNLRELENVLERAYLFAPGGVIEELPIEGQCAAEPPSSSLQAVKKRAAMEVEARVIADALTRAGGNVSAVARAMGITPRAVHMKLRAHGIDAASYRAGSAR
ncbi:MAG: sigma 54-interacting transcriptional regulator [Gammaproteobacteria bacterium]|nr:sigma 54-interacting transcriptional regulator [Gammaproteobacteria bacterium]